MFGVETQSTGLGNYNNAQDQQWRLDYVIDVCDQNGIHVMLCLDFADSYQANSMWPTNPYNV